MSDFISEIRDQLPAIHLAMTRPPRMHAPKVKAPSKMAYGWSKRSWPKAKFRSMILERIPFIDDALEDPVEVYKGLSKDEKGLVRELFEAQRNAA